MPRVVEITVRPSRTDGLIASLRVVDGLEALTLQRGGSLIPEGDLVTVEVTNAGARRVLKLLRELDMVRDGNVRTSEPKSLIRPRDPGPVHREGNEAIWEEMAEELRLDSNPSINYLLLMVFAGAIAAVGLWIDGVHLIIASQVIAPGFQPILRLPFGLVAGPAEMARRGVVSVVAGYLGVAVGGAVTVLVMRAVDERSPELASGFWVQHWSEITAAGVVLSVVASAAGALTVAADRAVFSAGAMIALGLMPSMALGGMATATGASALTAGAFARWGLDALAVMLVGGGVLAVKQLTVHRGRALG